jgi:hypothetical protein
MRPVKTVVRDGRPVVLTKTVNGVRRVSCSCCEEQEPDCCMYPANEFAVKYNQDDLPDSVAIDWPNNFFGVLEKDAATYKNEIITLDIANFRWRLRNSENGQSKIVGRCLFTEPTIGDTFPDTYTVVTFGGVEITVTRKALCVWEGQTIIEQDSFIALLAYGSGFSNAPLDYYEVPTELGASLKWELAVGFSSPFDSGSSAGTHIGPQNDPVGTYQDPISLETFFVNP